MADQSPVDGAAREARPQPDCLYEAANLCEAEANRWDRNDPTTSRHWRAVAADLRYLRVSQVLTDSQQATKPLADAEREAEHPTSEILNTRLGEARPQPEGLEKLRLRFDAAGRAEPPTQEPDAHLWECGCGWVNGPSLAVCSRCNRTPIEGQATQVTVERPEETRKW